MASRSLNRVILIGNLTRDPELKYTPSGTAICNFGIATNRNWITADGQTKDEVQYHRIVAWQKLAELCAKLLTKGRKVYLEGRLTYRTFTGKDGQQRSITEIVLDDFIVFNDGKKPITDENKTQNNHQNLKKDVSQEEPSDEEIPPPINEKLATSKEEVSQENNQSENINPEDIPF